MSNSAEDLSKLVIVGDELEDKGALKKSIAMKATRENATFFTQCRYLVLREVRNLRRDVKGLVARFGTVIFLNLLWFHLPKCRQAKSCRPGADSKRLWSV